MTRGRLLLRRIRLCWEKEYRYYGADDNGGGSPKVRSPLVEDNPYHRQLLEGHDHAVRAQASGNTHPEHDNRVLPPRLANYPPNSLTRAAIQARFCDGLDGAPPRGSRSVRGVISFIILLA